MSKPQFAPGSSGGVQLPLHLVVVILVFLRWKLSPALYKQKFKVLANSCTDVSLAVTGHCQSLFSLSCYIYRKLIVRGAKHAFLLHIFPHTDTVTQPCCCFFHSESPVGTSAWCIVQIVMTSCCCSVTTRWLTYPLHSLFSLSLSMSGSERVSPYVEYLVDLFSLVNSHLFLYFWSIFLVLSKVCFLCLLLL